MALDQRHLDELLKGSCIKPEVVEARGYRTIGRPVGETKGNGIDDGGWLRDRGFSRAATDRDKPALWPMLWIPTYRPTGEATGSGQIKPRNPLKRENGKEQKYVSPTGRSVQLDVHPWHKDKSVDPTVPMWVVEGVKKADCLTSHLTDGSMVVAIPGVYNWRSKHQTLGDWEDIVIKGREVVICFDSDARHNRLVSEAMRRFGNWLRAKGASKVTYAIPFEEINGTPVKGVDDFVAAGGKLEDLEYTKQPPVQIDISFSDRGLAERAADGLFKDRFCWTSGTEWMEWNGVRWTEVDDVRVREVLHQWFADQCANATRLQPKGLVSPEELKGWQAALQYGKVRAVAEVLKGMMQEDFGEFDSDPDLLNCPNGVVDLRTGKLVPHDPRHNMTKCTLVPYVEDAIHPDWNRALEAVPEDVLDWFQVRMGQAITGRRIRSDQVVFFHADGSNGKSTVLDLTAKCVGDYATSVSEQTLLAAAKDTARASATPELMAFKGARYAYLEETPEAGRLSSNRLKKLTGTAVITARPLYKPMVEFPATHTMFVSTNYRPVVDQGDRGTWRRLVLMTFPYTYVAEHELTDPKTQRLVDPDFRDRVSEDTEVLKAVLAWMVKGSIKSYDGLGELPPRLIEDSSGWRKSSDPVLRFVEENLVFEEGYWVSAMEVYSLFRQTMENEGLGAMSLHRFSPRLINCEAAVRAGVTARRGTASTFECRQSTRVGLSDPGSKVTGWLNVRFADSEMSHTTPSPF